jgi:hypothetical protein
MAEPEQRPRRRGQSTFRQRDVTAFLKGAEKAGWLRVKFEIDPVTGKFTVLASKNGVDPGDDNEWDQLLDENDAALRP